MILCGTIGVNMMAAFKLQMIGKINVKVSISIEQANRKKV